MTDIVGQPPVRYYPFLKLPSATWWRQEPHGTAGLLPAPRGTVGGTATVRRLLFLSPGQTAEVGMGG